KLALSLLGRREEVVPVAFPYFGGVAHEHFRSNDQSTDVLVRNVPVRTLQLAEGEARVATVFDLVCANYGMDRGLGGNCARSFDDDVPYTPAWQEPITGGKREQAIAGARPFAQTAEKTHGRGTIIIRAAIEYW